jgi:putative transposase
VCLKPLFFPKLLEKFSFPWKKTEKSNDMPKRKTRSDDEKNVRPFWSRSSDHLSKNLWQVDALADNREIFDSSWFAAQERQSVRRSPFQLNVSVPERKAELPAPPTPPNEVDTEEAQASKKKVQKQRKAPEPLKARKVRIFPNASQRQKLKLWLGAVRWTYNQCLGAVKKTNTSLSVQALRQKFTHDAAIPDWTKQIPYDVRDEAVRDFAKAIATRRAVLRKGPKKQRLDFSRWKFRNKKDAQESLVVHKKHWGRQRGAFADVFGPNVLKSSEPLPEKLCADTRLMRTRLGHFYLVVLSKLEQRSENQAPPEHSVIALDPGNRTFMTGYDVNGFRVVEWGAGDMKRLYNLCFLIDKFQSLCTKTTHRQRYRWKKRIMTWRFRIRNLVDELHKKLARWLCENYRLILLPKFETSKMVKRRMRKIGSKVARGLYTWAHYRFRERMLSKVREFPWCHVAIVNEAYTSKTCGKCGALNQKLAGKKDFQCGSCDFTADRDHNAARNILIKYLCETQKHLDEGGSVSELFSSNAES